MLGSVTIYGLATARRHAKRMPKLREWYPLGHVRRVQYGVELVVSRQARAESVAWEGPVGASQPWSEFVILRQPREQEAVGAR